MPSFSYELNHFTESKFPWFIIWLTLFYNSFENGWNVFGRKMLGEIRKELKVFGWNEKTPFMSSVCLSKVGYGTFSFTDLSKASNIIRKDGDHFLLQLFTYQSTKILNIFIFLWFVMISSSVRFPTDIVICFRITFKFLSLH